MGIKLSDVVPKRKLDFEELKNKRIAVDSSNMLYQFIASIRQPDGTPLIDSEGRVTSHLMGIFTRVSNLMQRDVKLAFVFDGKPPALKFATTEERLALKDKAYKKMREAEDDVDVDSQLKYAKQTSRLTKDMAQEAKDLIDAMGMPVIQAKSEAEAQAAYMCRRGDVWAVASSDFDNLVYGAKRMIQRLTLSDKRRTPSGYVWQSPDIIYLDDVLSELGINQKQLMYLGILVGTDYNPGGIKGIGQKKGLKLVKQHEDPDKLFEAAGADFDWREIVEVFENMPTEDVALEWKPVDKERMFKILVDKHDFNPERVEKTIEKITKRKTGQKSLGDF